MKAAIKVHSPYYYAILLALAYSFLPGIGSVFGAYGHICIMVFCIATCIDVNNIKIHSYTLCFICFIMIEMVFVMLYHDTFAFSSAQYNEIYYIKDIIIRYLDIFAIAIAIRKITTISNKEKRHMFIASLGMLLFTMYYSIIKIQVDPEIVRNMASQRASEDSTMGIANYNTVYASSLTVPVAFVFIKKGGKKCLAAIIYLAVLFVFLISCAFTLSLIVWVMMVILCCLFYYSKMKIHIKILLGGVFLYLLFLLYINIEEVLLWLAAQVSSSSLQVRLLEMVNFLSTGAITGDMEGRFDVYAKSLETFRQYPLTGILLSFESNLGVMTGDHSRILDMLARYGAMSTLYFIGAAKYMRSIRREMLNQEERQLLTICIFGGFVIEILNPMYEGFILVYSVAMISLSNSVNIKC